MTDQLEHDLADAFQSAAVGADVPRLPLDDVVTRGRMLQEVRRRRAALWTAAAAAVAVVAVCVPIAVAQHGQGHGRPEPTHQTTTPSPGPRRTPMPGPGPSLPYLDGTTLHANGQVFQVGKLVNLVSAGGTVLVGHWGRSITWQTLRGGRLVALPYGKGTVPVLSPDGTTAAVSTNPTPQTSRITVYDARTDHEIAHIDLDLPATCCDGGSVQGLGIDATGTVYWAEDTEGPTAPRMAWRPGSAPVQIHHGDGVFGVTPAGPLLDDGVLGHVVDGQWRQVATIQGDDDVWSPSGMTVAEGGGAPTFLAPRTGHATTPTLPGDLDRWIGFESETDVLGAVRDGSTAELVRCDVTTGGCTTIETLPDGWKSWQWATNGPAATAPGTPPTSSNAPDDSVVGLPRGDDAGIATISNGALTLQGRTLAQDVGSALEAGTTILVVRSGASGTSAYTVDQVSATGSAMPIPALGDADGHGPGAIGPVLSPDGTIAVGVDQDGDGATLTEWSLSRHRVLGRTRVPGGSPDTLALDGVDDHGRVYATTYAPRGGFTWLPGHAREPMTGTVAGLWAAGFHALGPDGVVDPKDCADQPVAVAPDGGHVLCDADSPSGFASFAANGAGGVPLKIPTPPKQVVGFESDTAVLVVVPGTGGDWLVRCFVADGTCMRAAPVAAGTTFPRLSGIS